MNTTSKVLIVIAVIFSFIVMASAYSEGEIKMVDWNNVVVCVRSDTDSVKITVFFLQNAMATYGSGYGSKVTGSDTFEEWVAVKPGTWCTFWIPVSPVIERGYRYSATLYVNDHKVDKKTCGQ